MTGQQQQHDHDTAGTPSGDGELAAIATRVASLPAPSPTEDQVAHGRALLSGALAERNAPLRRLSFTGSALARVAALIGAGCIVAASVGGAYAMGARVPESTPAAPGFLKQAPPESSATSSEDDGATIEQKNVHRSSSGDGQETHIRQENVARVESDGGTIHRVQRNVAIVGHSEQISSEGLPPSGLEKLLPEFKEWRTRLKLRIHEYIQAYGTPLHIETPHVSVKIDGDVEIEAGGNRVVAESGSVKVESGDTHVEAGRGSVTVESGDTRVEAERGSVEIESGSQSIRVGSGEVSVSGRGGTSVQVETSRLADPQEPDTQRIIDDARNKVEETLGDLPQLPDHPAGRRP